MHPSTHHRIQIEPTTPVHLTRHAQRRSAQRAIPPRVIEQLLVSGTRDHDHHGGIRVHLHQRRAQQNFARLTSAETLANYRNVYAVVDATDSTFVITVGWCQLTRRTDPSPRR